MKQVAVKECPKCYSEENVIPIRYGMPGPEMQQDFYEGKIKLGGCGIVENAPKFYCNKCENSF